MCEVSWALFESLRMLQSACDADAIVREASAMHKSTARDTNIAENNARFTFCAQIKLYIEIPELVWHMLEHGHCYSAAKYYLLSQRVYDSLSKSEAPDAKRLLLVVRRQRELNRQLKSQIIEHANEQLRQRQATVKV